MKYLIILSILAGSMLMAPGCRKSNSGNNGSSVTCLCSYRYIPGRDTTGTFDITSQPNVSDTTMCNKEAIVLDTMYGYGSCTVY